MYNKITQQEPIPVMTPEIAKEVNLYLKQYGNPSVAFVTTGKYWLDYYIDVQTEVEALEDVAYASMMRIAGTYDQRV